MWVKIKPPGIGPQVFVLGFMYQGSILGVTLFLTTTALCLGRRCSICNLWTAFCSNPWQRPKNGAPPLAGRCGFSSSPTALAALGSQPRLRGAGRRGKVRGLHQGPGRVLGCGWGYRLSFSGFRVQPKTWDPSPAVGLRS